LPPWEPRLAFEVQKVFREAAESGDHTKEQYEKIALVMEALGVPEGVIPAYEEASSPPSTRPRN